ncbi:DUF2235 domain-containing protein [Marinobacter sp. M3C]|jgi:uncharacterized protein (DUF2235 family)|uniref:DUF2235 domain-containing protein n=1 Tax=unclassified Marinobacter TaxID=83889 RepID=UPI00200C7F0F|nr:MULTISPECIES: DUF2235 domain-containing protein [unclassified Marinobacter]MCL1477225.1 DUF2235 domain-containing protein [Marinobacter sp.]MCL1480701.1 DUF2235 domain-containing protein [Marinobacter sp.]MCL1484925.1 DUF2235 domain-containing protein [Marinobacter sp.]MCL1485315.1 DUF2235 domain-containing protein [Marinobacter sp.]MCL1486544.1 DUF2235 domain-containing protein [Marinobacter sp.]
MAKRIVICADGTWNRPEEDLQKDFPTNVLRLARAITPVAADGISQQVFYDWGIGSYHNALIGGVTGQGLHKNILDGYRYLVQNYAPGDEVYLFGFSRGAYTVRALCGLINNCGIVARVDAARIQQAFEHYKKPGKDYAPDGIQSLAFRAAHSHPSRQVRFVGVWDTVGALGVPFSLMGLFDSKDEFYDTKLGSNVSFARHALAIDERREDFEPTLWLSRPGLDLQQVWFAGSHSDIGGGYEPDDQGLRAADYSLAWMLKEAETSGLGVENHLFEALKPDARAKLHNSRRHVFRFARPLIRPLQVPDIETRLHKSVGERWRRDPDYRPPNLKRVGFAG